jgi:hypothetical protein
MANKLNFNSAGLVSSADERGQYDMPDENANPFRYKLVNGEVVDGYPGVADADIMPLFNADNEAYHFDKTKADMIGQLRNRAASRIQALAWKIERATEQDALNGTSTINAVYAEREAIRVASNVAQASINAATSFEEAVTAFNSF